VRTFHCLLTLLLLASPALAREIYVNNTAGDDRFTGRQAKDPGGQGGPVKTLARALQMANASDIIILAKTAPPYRESISLVGGRHSGVEKEPFVILGNGAILDGSKTIKPEEWENYRGAVFRLRARAMNSPMLFINDKPATRAFAAQGAKTPPELQPRQWCSVEGRIYFCVDKTKLPGDYKMSYADAPTGITMFHVKHVRIADLTVQGFQVDGISLSNSAAEVLLSNVTCRGNGRNGVAVGGASSITIRASLLGDNGQAQLLTSPYSETRLFNTPLLSNTAPGWVDQGGRVYIDGKQAQGGKDELRPTATPEPKP
jgi:hypothetical protein